MENAKHTSGPWKYEFCPAWDDPGYAILPADDKYDEMVDLAIAVITYGGNNHQQDDIDRPIAEANARLIAASPDLADVAERVSDILGLCIDRDGKWICPPASEMRLMLDSARAALLKAGIDTSSTPART